MKPIRPEEKANHVIFYNLGAKKFEQVPFEQCTRASKQTKGGTRFFVNSGKLFLAVNENDYNTKYSEIPQA